MQLEQTRCSRSSEVQPEQERDRRRSRGSLTAADVIGEAGGKTSQAAADAAIKQQRGWLEEAMKR